MLNIVLHRKGGKTMSDGYLDRKARAQDKSAIIQGALVLLVVSFFLPPIIGLAWGIPVFKRFKKKAAAIDKA
jgi:hypothetical protein